MGAGITLMIRLGDAWVYVGWINEDTDNRRYLSGLKDYQDYELI
jgi:hypothetical protein